MIFILLILLCLVIGILSGIPTAPYLAPPSIPTLILFMSPWLILYFFSNHPTINAIRWMYFSWVLGVFCYWTYFETVKKIKGS